MCSAYTHLSDTFSSALLNSTSKQAIYLTNRLQTPLTGHDRYPPVIRLWIAMTMSNWITNIRPCKTASRYHTRQHERADTHMKTVVTLVLCQATSVHRGDIWTGRLPIFVTQTSFIVVMNVPLAARLGLSFVLYLYLWRPVCREEYTERNDEQGEEKEIS